MKIYEAATEVMRKTGRPMTASEIYKAIVQDQLFTVRCKGAYERRQSNASKKCDVPANKGKVLFRRTGPNTFTLAD